MRIPTWFNATLREWSWAHTGLGLLLGSLALFNMGELVFNLGDGFPLLRSWVYNVCEFGFPGVLALRMADRAAADGVPRLLAYGLAVVAIILVGVFLIGPLMFPFIGGEPEWGVRQDIMLSFNLLLTFSVGTVAYAHWRRANDTLQRVQATELGRAHEEQQLQSARLLALQARVEPQFLFDTLQRVRDGIGTATEEADRRLDDLIALLRALQPAVGATASTVARELGLVEAYGRAAGLPGLQPPLLQLHASALARPARLAPLLLLPALRALADGRHAWQIWVTVLAERLQISLLAAEPGAAALQALRTLDLAALRERAVAVHGTSALVRIETQERTALLFDLPLEHVPDPSPDR
jgi:hypothetical protein